MFAVKAEDADPDPVQRKVNPTRGVGQERRRADLKFPMRVPKPLFFLKEAFHGEEIATNACEDTFGDMDTPIRSGRDILLKRSLTKNMLKSGNVSGTVVWFDPNYPMNDIGRGGASGAQEKLIVRKSYEITYQYRATVKTERIIDIIESKRKFVAHCHSRNAIRTYKRSRIKNIIPV
ncbi:MAG: hypothetical protein ACYCT2_05455 [Thermoplasmataceae archaeon]